MSKNGRTTARLYHSVCDFASAFTVSRHVRSQQHRLLHGECLLCVPVVWSSKQLGELLPYDGLLLLELCPVVAQGIRVFWESELRDGRHLSSLEAGGPGHPTRGLRGQLILRCPRGPVYGLLRPAFWQVVRGVHLASLMPLKSVIQWSVDL